MSAMTIGRPSGSSRRLTVESFGVWHRDGNDDGGCKAVWICATASGKKDQEACYGHEKGEKR
ncbi:MAG: hypothetical protein ACPGSH_05555, partial [Ilumatobacteraceae bacterium]